MGYDGEQNGKLLGVFHTLIVIAPDPFARH